MTGYIEGLMIAERKWESRIKNEGFLMRLSRFCCLKGQIIF